MPATLVEEWVSKAEQDYHSIQGCSVLTSSRHKTLTATVSGATHATKHRLGSNFLPQAAPGDGGYEPKRTRTEQDYHSIQVLQRQREYSVPDVVCFLCQQCAEKYLKAFLVSRKIAPSRVHHLDRLNDLCVDVDTAFALLEDAALVLNPFAVEFRYPGEQADASNVERAVRAVGQVREFVRARLGLSTETLP